MSSKNTKRAAAGQANIDAAVARAKAVNVEDATAALGKAQVSLSRVLGDVQEQLIQKVSQLEDVETAITAKKLELEATYGAERVLADLDDLQAQLVLETQLAGERRQAMIADEARRHADQEVDRQREGAAWAYAREVERARDKDEWEAAAKQRARDEAVRVAEFERTLAERERDVAGLEAAVAARADELRTAVDEVKEDLARRHAYELNNQKREMEHLAQIARMASDAALSNLAKDVESTRAMVSRLETELATTRAQLAEAVASQTQLAKATVDAAQMKTATAEAMSTFTNIAGGSNSKSLRG